MRDVQEAIKKICNECGAKCCKSSLSLPDHHLTLYPGDFTRLVKSGYIVCLSRSVLAGHIQSVIRPHIFGYCPLLNVKTSECTIYDKRPLACKVYPYEPQGMLVNKDYCLLYKRTSKEKREALENKNHIRFTRPKYVQKYREDNHIFKTLFQQKIDEALGKKPKLITSEKGSFSFSSNNKSTETSFLPKLYSLLNAYAKYFTQKEVYISILVSNTEYYPLCHIKGVFGSSHKFTIKGLIDRVTDVMGIYFGQIFDGSLLDGIIFEHELHYDFEYWDGVWSTMKSSIKEFKSLKADRAFKR